VHQVSFPVASWVGFGLSEREPYVGYALQAIDAKGRVAIPGDLRNQLDSNGAEKRVYVDLHEDESCLVCFDKGWINALRAQINDEQQFERGKDRAFDLALARRAALVSAEPAAFDASGRFIVPPYLMETAGLQNLAFFAGALEYFEVWNPHTLLKSARAPDRTKRLVEWHLKQRGLA
jgi:MraZ protein